MFSLTAKIVLLVLIIFTFAEYSAAGPLSYAICQTGCNALAVACYSAAGAIFGVTAGLGAPAAVLACNTGLGACMAACVAAGCAPIP